MDGTPPFSRTDPAPALKEPGGAPDTPLALIDLGALVIGIDVADLREVMTAPQGYEPLPSTVPGVVGAVALRGQVIPVVDIAPLLGYPALFGAQPPHPGAEVVVIVGAGEEAYGILACGARQIVARRDTLRQSLIRRSEALTDRLMPEVVLINGAAIGLFDARVLPDIGVPLACGGRVQRQRRDPADQFLVFQVSGVHFGLPLAVIEATLPAADVDASVLRSGPSEGGVVHNHVERALVNLAPIVGLTPDGVHPTSRASSILLPFEGGGSVALRADRVCDIRSFAADQIAPMPSLLSPRPHLFLGVHVLPDGTELFLLDGARIFAEPVLKTLAQLAHDVREDPSAEGGERGGTGTHVTQTGDRRMGALLIEAGARAAFSLEDVREIVARPPLRGDRAEQGAYLGTMALRDGALIPVFALAPLLGHPPTPPGPSAAIVVIDRRGERVGLAIDRICGVEPMTIVSPAMGATGAILERRRGEDRSYWETLRPERLPLSVSMF